MIEKRGMTEKGEQLVSIKNVGNERRMNYDYKGNILLPSEVNKNYYEWRELQKDLWYIMPVEQSK